MSRWIGLLVVALALTGCAKNPPPDPDPSSPEADIVIIVQNRRIDDIVTYLVRDGRRERLGLVTAQADQSFSVRYWRVANAIRLALAVSPIAGNQRYVTEQLILRPGSEVSLTVTPVLRQSFLQVY
jgi:hypothetical protein